MSYYLLSLSVVSAVGAVPINRITPEKWAQEVEALVGNEYTFLSPYVKSKENMKVKHNTCGHEYEVSRSRFIAGSRCPKCRGVWSPSPEEWQEEVNKIHGDRYIFLDDYINSTTKIRFQCNKCKASEYMTPSQFKKNEIPCPRCRKEKSIEDKTREWNQTVIDLVGNEYVFLEPFKLNNSKMLVIHSRCKHIYRATKSHFLRGRRCPNCFGNPIITEESWREYVSNEVGDEYIFLEPYINATTKLKCRHNKCGTVYMVNPNRFSQGRRCPHCFGKFKKTTEQFKKEVYDLVGEEYTVVGEYDTARKPITIKHELCEREWDIVPYAFKTGNRCPNCSSSKGEAKVREYLEKMGIGYKEQYYFNDLKKIEYLLFDFAIFKDNVLIGLIEYDGEQHFEPIDYFGGIDKFNSQKENDGMKNSYCKRNNIPLIRIPYWDYDDIEDILDSEIKKL